jgi:phage baseplate assembly protein gpV
MSNASAEIDRRVENLIRVGRVVSVDAGSATAIVSFGDLESPALPVSQLRAGAVQFWWMPTVGEQVVVACEGGDVAQGVIIASVYAGNAPSSDGAEPMINLGGGRMHLNGDLIVAGDVIASGISLVKHTHGGVVPGVANTKGPN